MTATTAAERTPSTTPTPGGTGARPWHPDAPAGCARCGTTDRPHYARHRCEPCYARDRHHGVILTAGERAPFIPIPAGAIVAPGMVGIARCAITSHLRAAECELEEAGREAAIWGAVWRARHPEQFTPAALRAIFGADLSGSYWAADDAAKAA